MPKQRYAVMRAYMPTVGTRGIEPRSGGVNGDHTLVFTFANALTSVGSASTSNGNAVKLTASPSAEMPWLTRRTLKSWFWARGISLGSLMRTASRVVDGNPYVL